MSLYRHVRDKDDLLDEVTDGLLAEVWKPRTSRRQWRKWTAEAAERLRGLLVSEPVALHVYLSHPVVSPAAISRMDAMLNTLRDAGFGETSARRAYGALHTYTIGFAAVQASRLQRASGSKHENARTAELATLTTRAQFKSGVELLLDGIELANDPVASR